jgi:putative ABC transport system substrate-binding protein
MTAFIGRRAFITLLGGAAVAWPVTAKAQQPAKVPTIGFFSAGSAAALQHWVAALAQRLRELGWSEGSTVAIEYLWADGHEERLYEIAADFVRRRVDVIVTHSAAPVIAAKQATSSIPIVFAIAADPIGTGLIASLARPGGNVTGLSFLGTDLAAKRIELLREIVPGLRRLAVLANVSNPGVILEMNEVQATASTLGLAVTPLEIRRSEDIPPAFDRLWDRAEFLYVCADALLTTNRIRINILAAGAHLPTIYASREYVEAGGLISYGPNIPALFRRAGDYVDKILRGAKPGDIPVEQPTKFDLVVNLVAARAVGVQIPDKLLAVADEVIE